jgi:transposase
MLGKGGWGRHWQEDNLKGPNLQPSDKVVFYDLRVFKAAGLAELVEARGSRLRYLPPYSPDFIPSEMAFSKLKPLRTVVVLPVNRWRLPYKQRGRG